MNAKELIIYNGSQWQGIKSRHNCIVNIKRILVIALQAESEMLRQMPAFMITPKQIDLVRIIQLEGEEVNEAFHGKVTAIHVITQEEESFLGRFDSGYLEHFYQIVVLAVNVTNN